MNKPQSVTTTRKGTKIYNILDFVINAEPESFFTYVDLAEHLELQEGISIDANNLGKIINYYNEGLYVHEEYSSMSTPIKILRIHGRSKVAPPEDDGQIMMTFAERCVEQGIDPSEARGGWVKSQGLSVRVDKNVNEVKELNDLIDAAKIGLEKELLKLKTKPKKVPTSNDKVGVLNLADLHLGAFVNNLKKTPDYSATILCQRLEQAAEQVNRFGYRGVHVNILGDFLETLGNELAHPSMWKELENGIYGFKAIQLCVQIIHDHLLDKINNLEEVNLISGNHDRGTADSKNDTEGMAAQTIAWGLELLGYKINFDSLILSEVIDGINYIMLHGDKLLSKRSGKEIAWEYGKQGMFNFILEGHLHSRIQKAQTQKNVETTKIVSEDAGQTRRQNCPSVFTGNRYSEHGGWNALGGYLIIENNGVGHPNVFDFTFTL